MDQGELVMVTMRMELFTMSCVRRRRRGSVKSSLLRRSSFGLVLEMRGSSGAAATLAESDPQLPLTLAAGIRVASWDPRQNIHIIYSIDILHCKIRV